MKKEIRLEEEGFSIENLEQSVKIKDELNCTCKRCKQRSCKKNQDSSNKCYREDVVK